MTPSSSSFRWRPAHTGMAAATLLFLLYIPRWLVELSPMGGSFAFDYFTLPRCGLAIRNATNVFTSSADYAFGYHATNWASHPMLCVVLGVPFSYVPPWPGFWLSNLLYLLVHVYILRAFGSRLAEGASVRVTWTHHVLFAALGLSFPWYMNYHLGQYHIVFVLALSLALQEKVVAGFTLSALGKPALAPAALCLAWDGRWRAIIRIGVLCVLGYAPFLLFYLDDQGRLAFGFNRHFLEFLDIASLYSRHTVRGWDQEMGWSKVLDEWIPGGHYPLRLSMTLALTLGGVLMARRNLALGIAFTSLWFFFSYGRIHEYHYATFVPILAWAATQERVPPGALVAAAVGLGAPTIWPFLKASAAFVPSKGLDFALARATEPVLFWSWMLQRPLCVVLVAVLLARTWWASRKETRGAKRK